MIIAAWALLLGLLTWLFQARLDEFSNPNQELQRLQGEVGVVLKRNRAGHYLAPGQINGHPVLFLLDTGATSVAVPQGLAQRLGLKPGGVIQSITANGRVQAWRTRLDEVRLGPIVKTGVSGVIMPNMPGDQVLLGMSFLRSLELVQRDGRLILRP
ncbi:TIGR02281 family clan AA aspartic protease [Magnetovirga frankeli]|nr:TIGR02281 family clan AA aspartic protease [gamma proteobacterium SS-5]